MSTSPRLLLSAPTAGAIPCFLLPEFELREWGVEGPAAEQGTAILATGTVVPLPPAGVVVPPAAARPSSLPLFGVWQSRKARMNWTPRCTHILVANAPERTNAEIVQLIEAETGLRFSLDTVNTRRSLLGLDSPGRNQWTSPLRRWRPWQGGKLS